MTEIDAKKQIATFEEDLERLPADDRLALSPVLHYFRAYALELLNFQKEVEATHSNPDAFDSLKGRLLGVLGGLDRDTSAYGTVLQRLTPYGKGLLEKMWSWFSGTVASGVLRVVADPLQIETWSFGVTTGFPSGISTTVTVNFKGV